MRPAVYNLDLYRGDTYAWQFVLYTNSSMTTPADLTGVVAKAELRQTSGSTPIASLICDVEQPNKVNVNLTVLAWDTIAWSQGRWDLQLTYPAGEVITILKGEVTVTPDITDSVLAVVASATSAPARPMLGGLR